MLHAAIIILAAISLARANSCSDEETCESCIRNNACAYVLGQSGGDQSSSYMCMNAMDSRKRVSVSLRIRDPEDCVMVDDTTTERAGLPSSMQNEMQIMTSETDTKCPTFTPLMIAFFILSLLLAILVSIVTTIACWVGCYGDEHVETPCNQQPSPTTQEHELMQTV